MDELAIGMMKEYVRRLNEAADAYYNGRGEKMTDFEWDALFDRVKALEKETGVVLPDSPTNRVSADAVAGQKEPHEFAALSLAKTKKVSDLVEWAGGRPVWISWKLDGLTLVVTWDGGVLKKVVTRGDGHIGTNITHLADAIAGIPKKIPFTGHLVVRGECVISWADFASFTSESEEAYANPRNLASGSLTLKDVEAVRARHLQWVPFTLVEAEGAAASAPPVLQSWGGGMDWLEGLGMTCVERELVKEPTEANVQACVDRFTKKVTDRICPFPVDGLVVTYDDVAYAKTGSVTGHHATRAGLAFKWQDETAETTLDHIEWSCAVGRISPVAVFEPVSLEGTIVKRASLCNVSECERLGIGGRGTRLRVIKANKIIPKVIGVIGGREAPITCFSIPDKCPVCGAATEVRVSESGVKTLVCTNPDCTAKNLRRFERFVSKEGLDIDGLAGETLAKFINRGWIRTAVDIYRLGAHQSEIAAMDGFGALSAENIVTSIAAARTRGAVQVLVALNIPMCGTEVAKKLLASCGGTVEGVRERALCGATGETMAPTAVGGGLPGIGPVKGQAVVDWFAQPANQALVDDLLREITVTPYVAAAGVGTCAGLTFVITGDVHIWKNRAELKTYIESQGGKVTGSVSKATSYLINNDVTSTSGKNRKAQELGIPVVSEAEFQSRFGI